MRPFCRDLSRPFCQTCVAKTGVYMQMAFVAIITATLFLRTHIHRQTYADANLLAGFLFYTLIQLFFNGIAEM